MFSTSLDNTEIFFFALLDSINDAVTCINHEGTVLYWNKIAEEMYDIPKEKIIGRKISEFFQRGSLMLLQVLESGLPVYKVYHQPRQDKHVLINTVPVRNMNSDLIGVISVEQDITDVVKLSQGQFHLQSNMDRSLQELLLQSNSLGEITSFIRRIAISGRPFPMLLVGETGVGKEVIARIAHTELHCSGPFLVVPCDALPVGLIDSELFGYESLSFGTNIQATKGKLELAAGGTVYLSNIHAIPYETQLKLAQCIRERAFNRIGGDERIELNVQIIGGSFQDLPTIEASLACKDLYYQFHALEIPPLRKRRQDLPMLWQYSISSAARTTNKPIPQISSEVMAFVSTFSWPGNMPELMHAAEHLVIVSAEEPLTLKDLPAAIRPKTIGDIVEGALTLNMMSEEVEHKQIEEALERAAGNKAQAARLLGISRGSLYYKLKHYHLK